MHQPEAAPRQLSLELTVGADFFALSGEFTMAEAVTAFKEWAALLGGRPGELAEIAKITAEVEEETKKDTAALGTATT